MSTNVLDAIDAVYLQAFRENLLHEVLRAFISLKRHLGQGASLATAQELTPAVRQTYEKIATRLPPLITALGETLRQLEELPSEDWRFEPDLDLACMVGEKTAMLDAAEADILNVLNGVGNSLEALSRSILTWDDSARLRTRATMKRHADRPCYDFDLPIDICNHPFLIAEYSSKPEGCGAHRPAHYLVNEIMPVGMLPLLETVHVEVEVRGEALVRVI